MRSGFRLLAAAAITAFPMIAWGGLSQAAAGDPLTITANPVDSGVDYSISGERCVAPRGSQVNPQVLVLVGNAAIGVAPDQDGSWQVTLTAGAPGKYTVQATCDFYQGEFAYAPEVLTVQDAPPTITDVITTTTSPPVVTSSSPVIDYLGTIVLPDYPGASPHIAQGAVVRFEGAGFVAGEGVDVILHSEPIVLAAYRADIHGALRGSFTIPLDTPVGAHTIDLGGEGSDRSASAAIFVIDDAGTTSTPAAQPTTTSQPTTSPTTSPDGAAVPGDDSGSGSSLANTGVDNAGGMSAFGVGLAGVGGAMLLMTRRRATGRHH